MGDDEAEVRAAAERLVAAFGSGQLEDYIAGFTEDTSFKFNSSSERLETV